MSDTECRACNDSAADELRRCVRQMAQDGLDIDDPTTHPTWTGKVTIDGVTHDVAEVVAERDRMRARVAELEAALRGLVAALEGSEGVTSSGEPCMPGCPMCLAQIAARKALKATGGDHD